MTITDENRMAAPCGTPCQLCVCVKAGSDPALMESLLAKGFAKERLPCPGCREVRGLCPVLGVSCATYRCAAERGVDFCRECPDFPCGRLNPAAHRADVLPHNLKVFHLCYQQAHGLEAWKAKAEEMQNLYFRGTMRVGEGPALGTEGTLRT